MSSAATTDTAASASKDAEVQLLWAIVQFQGTKGINWADVAKFLKPDDPEKTGTVSKRWSRLKIKLEKELGTLEDKGITVTPKKPTGAAGELEFLHPTDLHTW